MPPVTRKKVQASDAITQSVTITGSKKDRIALDAAEAFANSVRGKPTEIAIGYFPNALVARSVTMLLITKAAITIAKPMAEYSKVCLDFSKCSGLPELVI